MRVLLAILATLLGPLSQAIADDRPSTLEAALLKELAFTEEFSSTKRALEGLIKPGSEGAWTVTLDGARAIYANDTDSSAARYLIINRMHFPAGPGRSWQTDGAQTSLTVHVSKAQGGAAGLVAGYSEGDYLVFAIGERKRYAIYQKKEGKLRALASGDNDAILPVTDNRLSLSQDEGVFRFSVNGVDVFETTDTDLRNAPIGIGVVGKGVFALDDLTVEPSKGILERLAGSSCGIASPHADDLVAVVASHEGAATSTVSVVGQDAVTSAIDVEVAPGDQPIYLVISSEAPTIWRFSGSVERLSHVASLGPIGVAGAAPAVVALHPEERCLLHSHREGGAVITKVGLSLQFGRLVDLVVAENTLSVLDLPTGRYVTSDSVLARGLPEIADSALLRDALRFTPGGIASLEETAVLSSTAAESYHVLPQEWGLIELINNGSIERTPGDRRGQNAYRILKPMRFPAGLEGSHAVTFHLPDGTPMPDGDPGHSEIVRVPVSDPSE